jgi:hypothetical protein
MLALQRIIRSSTLDINRSLFLNMRSAVSSGWSVGKDSNEKIVEDCKRLSRFAYIYHTGFFCDDLIENTLNSIATTEVEIDTAATSREISSKSRRVLHVATCMLSTGGHTRFLLNWIRSDLSSTHELVLTNQTTRLPEFVQSFSEAYISKMHFLPELASDIEKSIQLQEISESASVIVLHHNPDDVIPNLAYSRQGGPPVIFFNHAHFWFSLGSSIADLTLNTLPYYQKLSSVYRQVSKVELIRPLYDLGDNPLVNDVLSQDQRLRMELPTGVPLILTIGHEEYFKPDGIISLFDCIAEILDRVPTAHAVIIGPDGSEQFSQRLKRSRRVHFTGKVIDPIPFYQSSDLVLESFPQPSLGAFLEAVGFGGCYPVPAYSMAENIYRIDLPVIKDIVPRPRNRNEYVDHVVEVLTDIGKCRKGRHNRQLMYRDYCERTPWSKEFERIYQSAQCGTHRPIKLSENSMDVTLDSQILARNSIKDAIEEVFFRLPSSMGLTVLARCFGDLRLHARILLIIFFFRFLCRRVARRLVPTVLKGP